VSRLVKLTDDLWLFARLDVVGIDVVGLFVVSRLPFVVGVLVDVWLFGPLFLRLLAILITTTATTTRYILNALYHIISSSSIIDRRSLELGFLCLKKINLSVGYVVLFLLLKMV
jgi:hypothetical protein